jgi:hypothetical protein
MVNNQKKKANWFVILFYIYLFGGVLFIFFGPDPKSFGGGRPRGGIKACYSNLRVLQGAVEMYNMDVVTKMTSLDQPTLINGKYIKSSYPLFCPITEKKGIYTEKGNLTEDGEIICTYHGGLIAEGIYNKEKKEEHSRFNISINDCLFRIHYSIFWPLFWFSKVTLIK